MVSSLTETSPVQLIRLLISCSVVISALCHGILTRMSQFGNAAAAYVLQDIAGFKMEPLPVK